MNLVLCVLAVLAQGPVEAPAGELAPEAVAGVDYFVTAGGVHWLTGDPAPPIFLDAPLAESVDPPHQVPEPMPLEPGVPDVQDPSITRLVLFEGNVFPEEEGWERESTFDADRMIDHGWVNHFFELGQWEPGPAGEMDWYRKSFASFAGEGQNGFFIEWRVRSDAPGWIVDVPVHGTPCALVAAGDVGVNYHFTISASLVRFIRHLSLPTVWLEIDPDLAHTYRLELIWDQADQEDVYTWYVDGQQIASGSALGPYPTLDSRIIWGGRYDYVEHTLAWDYVRYGKIPQDGSGDYDSDGAVDLDDYPYLHECMLGSDANAGPGCSFADFDTDADVDLRDFARVQNRFSR